MKEATSRHTTRHILHVLQCLDSDSRTVFVQVACCCVVATFTFPRAPLIPANTRDSITRQPQSRHRPAVINQGPSRSFASSQVAGPCSILLSRRLSHPRTAKNLSTVGRSSRGIT